MQSVMIFAPEEIKVGSYGWIECNNWDFATLYEVDSIEGDIVYYDHSYLYLSNYNKATSEGWRMWKTKPTKEQMRALPWEGKPDKYNEWLFSSGERVYNEAF